MSDTTNTPLDVKSGTGITTLSSSVTSAIIESGGILSMTSGGVVSSVTVEDGGKLFVGKAGDHTSEPGVQGTVSGGTVADGSFLTISGGGLIENTTVATNAFVVASGAAASNVTLSGSDALESLYGTDSGTVILAGAKQDINDGVWPAGPLCRREAIRRSSPVAARMAPLRMVWRALSRNPSPMRDTYQARN
nr:hypothetical protein [Acetobacter estunensis]